jgi:predicted DsbA family dithiol-disulfide isomerase
MNDAKVSRKPDSLVWGKGPRILEIFFEPTCPFSAKTFKKLDALLALATEDSLTIKIRFLSQPWHLFSAVVVRSILAASTMAGGRETAKKVMAAVVDHREEFEFVDHCKGPNLEHTPVDLIRLMSKYSGVDLEPVFQEESLTNEIKWHAKYARQNGILATPTFMIDGIVAPEMSSGQDVEKWVEILKLP